MSAEVDARLTEHASVEGPQIDRLGGIQEDLLRQLGVLIQGSVWFWDGEELCAFTPLSCTAIHGFATTGIKQLHRLI